MNWPGRGHPRNPLRAIVVVTALTVALLACAPGGAAAASHGKARHGHAKRQIQRPTYWGAWIGSQITGEEAPWDMSAVSALSGMLGKGLSLIEFSSPMADCHQHPCKFYEFPREQMEHIRAYGAIPFFSWSTSSSPADPNLNDPDFQLADIAAGAYDTQIFEFAHAAAAWGHPFFLRFNWEMNGNWMPWSEGVNGNAPGTYVAAWRHVHDIFTAAGATNATWVWCPYVDIDGLWGNLRAFYPGNSYVDWTGLDGFNWAQNPANPQKWRTFDEIFAHTYQEMTTRIAPKKPMILAEMASNGGAKAKATWIRDMFKLLRTDYRRIRGVIWFNKVDRGVQWPLEISTQSLRAFSKGVRGPGFRTNRYWELPPGPVRPPR